MRRGLAAIAAVLLLAGCGDAGEGSLNDWNTVEHKLPDGRTVDCVVWSGIEKGGIDCDWDGAR